MREAFLLHLTIVSVSRQPHLCYNEENFCFNCRTYPDTPCQTHRSAPFRHAHRRYDRIVYLYDVIRKWVQQVQTGSLGSTGKVAASPQFLIAFRVYRHPERSRGISIAGSESQDAYVGKT